MIKFTQFTLLLFILYVDLVNAYPNFIGHGYSSCMICHFNPSGNGPLTDYGRMVAATAIASRDFFPKSTTDEKLADYSGFFFKDPSEKSHWRPSLKGRWINYQQNVGAPTEKSESILMQATAQLVWNGGARKQWIASGDFGYAPDPRIPTTKKEDNYRSREHYLGYRFSPSWGVYLGLMDKAFGIKIPEHAAFSRVVTANGMNDQVHGVMVHGVGKSWELFVQPFLGNFAQSSELRQKGVTSLFEYGLNDKTRIGVSAVKSKSDFLERLSYAGHIRLGVGQGSAIQGEYGFVKKTPVQGSPNDGQYGLLQGYVHLRRGLYWINTFEYSRPNTEKKDYIVRIGPSLQYFPAQRIELRLDLMDARTFQKSSVTDDARYIIAQVHVWF